MNPTILKTSSFILKISSVGFIVAACYHLLAIFIVLNDSPVWRNLLFVFVNLWCAFEIRKVKKYFFILFTLLFIQQLISHGGAVMKGFHEHHTDWLGVFALAAITIIYLALIPPAIRTFKAPGHP